MTSLRTLPQSFVGGELSQRMLGRPDDPKYQHGAARLRNFYVEPSGAARNRPGTEFVRATRNPDRRARLVPFRTAGGEAIQVELGFRQEYPGSSTVPGYARFHHDGGTVLHSRPWSAAVAYVAGDLVMSGGRLYRCVLAHTNELPASPSTLYWQSLEYVPNRPFTAAAAAPPTSGIVTGTPGEIYFGAGVQHGLWNGEPIEFTGDAGTTAPAGITYGVVYFAIVVDPERIRVAATQGGPAIAITTVGTGTFHRMHRRYTAGGLVSQGGNVFYVRTTRPIDGSGLSIVPASGNETFWYLEPTLGEFELPTTFAITEDELFAVTYSQQSEILTQASRATFVCELQQLEPPTWRWQQVSFVPALAAPTGVAAVATKRGATLKIVEVSDDALRLQVKTETDHHLVAGIAFVYIEGSVSPVLNDRFWGVRAGVSSQHFKVVDPDTGAYIVAAAGAVASGGTARETRLNSDESNAYVVTAVADDGRESLPSSTATVANNLFVTGAYNTISWAAVPGAVRYRLYRRSSGIFGLLGQTSALTFKDDGRIAPDLSLSPPTLDSSLASAPDHTTPAVAPDATPGAVTHHEGRRCFGGTRGSTQDVWTTRSNTESDLSYSIPVKATDRIHQRLKAPSACAIRHLVPLGQSLVALTDTTEFRIGPIDSDALTPDSFAARRQSAIGAAAVQPVVLHNVLIFAGARGGHLYQMGWREDVGGYLTADLCERANHLFDGASIVQIAAQLAPVPIVWCVSSTGRLLGVTFVPGQQVLAWHWHDTDGAVESVSVGGERGEDRIYMIVRRTINGTTRRYVERLAPFGPTAWNDTWLVDSGFRYSGAPVSTVAGLDHLEGKTVAVFADGLVQTQKVVAGGAITLDAPASKVLVGLPITAELQTVPATFAIEAYGGGRPKSVSQVWVRIEASGTFEVGPSLADLIRPDHVVDGVPFSGLVPVRVPNEWTLDGQLFVRQLDPLPLTVVSITAEMAVGG